MAQKTDLELSVQADEIRDETTALANTALRVGTALEDIVDSKMNNVAAYTAPFPQVTAAGTDTYTATLSPAITAYATGQKFQLLFTNANTGAATLALNGLAALAITKNGATALSAGDIPAGSIKILAYDGTRLQIVGDGGGSVVIGVQDFFIPASAFWPRVTNGCSPLAQTEIATSLINIQTLDFNQTTQQYAQVHFRFPKKYNLGTLTYEIEWTAVTGTGSVVWGVSAVALADGDALTTAFGTQVNVTDAAGTADTERTSPTSAAVTIGNTPAVADGIYLQITRVTGDGSDDMAADAKFKGIAIHLTTNAATDA